MMYGFLDMQVTLKPLTYVQQPDNWGIDVVGEVPGIGLPVVAPYEVSLLINSVIGTEGIEVIGVKQPEKIDVAPKTHKPTSCQDWVAVIDSMPPGPSKLIVSGTCTFPTRGYCVELKRHVPQGINPRDLLLDRIVIPPTGAQIRVITTIDARYEEPAVAGQFDTVTILPDGSSIPVEDVC